MRWCVKGSPRLRLEPRADRRGCFGGAASLFTECVKAGQTSTEDLDRAVTRSPSSP